MLILKAFSITRLISLFPYLPVLLGEEPRLKISALVPIPGKKIESLFELGEDYIRGHIKVRELIINKINLKLASRFYGF